MKKVAVTGLLASGKTTVCGFFRELGAFTISADEIVHQLLSSTEHLGSIHNEVRRISGLKGDLLDRAALADVVFEDSQKLAELEALLHPEVFKEIEKQYAKAQKENYPLFVAEIPLLDENPYLPHFDVVIRVKADNEILEHRFLERKKSSLADFKRRTKRQLLSPRNERKADYTIENNGSWNTLKNLTSELYSLLTSTRGI